MPYQANIPAATDRINASQADIQANFIQLQADFGVNHVTYNALADVGKHNVVTFPNQAAIPASVASEFIIYNKIPAAPYPLTTFQELFIQRNGGGSAYSVPFTAKDCSSANQAGYTFLPSGIIIKFGYIITVAGGVQTLSFTADGHFGPAFNDIPWVTATVFNNSAVNYSVQTTAVNAVQFTVRTCRVDTGVSTGGVTVYWVAIGKTAL